MALKASSKPRSWWSRAWRHISNHQVWSAVVGGLILALLLGGVALAFNLIESLHPFSSASGSHQQLRAEWGPERPSYPCDDGGGCKGGDHVSLDSTVNTPTYGDERRFLSAKIEGDVGRVKDRLEVEPGDVLTLRVVVANDGDPNHPHYRPLLARGVTAQIELPRDPAEEAQVVAWLSADNASPKQIYDSLVVAASGPVGLRFIDGSAKLGNAAHPDGLPLPDTLFGDGTLLGYERLDGRLDTCFCHSGIVLAKVVVSGA